jgi:hypothetical protein
MQMAKLAEKMEIVSASKSMEQTCMKSLTNFPFSSTVIGFSTTTVTFCDCFVGCSRQKKET